jgi:hypothetical protein
MANYAETFTRADRELQDANGRESTARLLKRWQRLALGIEQAEAELREAQIDLSIRRCCHDWLAIARDTGATWRDMLVITACSMWEAVQKLHRSQDTLVLESWPDGQLSDDEAVCAAARFRDALFAAASNLRQTPRLRSVIGRSFDQFALWVAGTGDGNLLAVLSEVRDLELLEAIGRGATEDGPLSQKVESRLRERVVALTAEHDRRIREGIAVSHRLNGTWERIRAPFNKLLEVETVLGFPDLLCWTYVNDVNVAFLAQPLSEPAAYRFALLPEHAKLLPIACADPMFWYVGLTALLRESGAILGYGLRSWAPDLFGHTIQHPGKVLRYEVPPDALRTRSILAKRIAPMLKGYHPDDGVADKLRALGRDQPVAVLMVFADYLAQLACKDDRTTDYRNSEHRRLVERLWEEDIGPHCRSVLQWIANGVVAADEILSLEEQSAQHSIPIPPVDPPADTLEPDAAAQLQAEPEIESVAEEMQPVAPAETWFYVPKPGAASLELVPVELPAEGRVEAFVTFMGCQGIGSIVKAGSIFGALEHFLDTPASIRSLTPYDDLNGRRWHKLKRGAQRIYVRLEPDGRLLFHPYARRDWKPSWTGLAS